MSVEKLGEGKYLVRWRDSAGRSRSKTVYRQRDANALDDSKKRLRSMGELIVHERGSIELRDFWQIWKRDYGSVHISVRTLALYDRMWDKHVASKFGRLKLESIDASQVSLLVAQLNRTLAPATTRRLLGMLQGVLQRAVEWRYISVNPVRGARRPPADSRRGRALSNEQLAALCSEMSQRSSSIVSVLAHTGLRPGELRALRWSCLSQTHIRVEHAVSADVIGPTKTRKQRSVALTPAARRTLLAWFMASGQPHADELVFPSTTGGIWRDGAYSTWSRKWWTPATVRAGLKGAVVYDLRHTFASRLIAEGCSVVEVARQMGNSPTQTLETYAHEFEQQRAQPVASVWHAQPSIAQILSSDGR